jgi:hypothetical protein
MSEATVIVRTAESTDAEAIYDIYSHPRGVWGTFQLPFPSLEVWRKRLTQLPEGQRRISCYQFDTNFGTHESTRSYSIYLGNRQLHR